MNNIATPETAKLLKEAGFPQPLPQEGQIWYGLIKRQEEPILIFKDRNYFVDKYGNYHMKGAFGEFGTFAPTATDILKELGKSFVLYYDDQVQMWFCVKIAITPQEVRLNSGHTNPAEAAAKAFLYETNK